VHSTFLWHQQQTSGPLRGLDALYAKGASRLAAVYSTITQCDQFVGRLWKPSPLPRYAKMGEQTAVQMRNPGVAGV
jgi:hypothetical protein